MKRISWLVLLLTVCLPLRANTNILVESIKKMVVFIYAADANGEADKNHPLGTGFLVVTPVGVTPNLMGKDAIIRGELLLVTARHIVDPAWAFCSGPQPSVVYLRVNKKNYDPAKDSTGVDYVRVPLVKSRERQYFVSEDDKVDAAVIDVGEQFSPDKYDFQAMRLSVFASPDEISKMGIGDSVTSPGLIPGKSGEKRNYPFFKFGNISNIPDEPVEIACDRRMPELRLERVWFVAANLVGGNSGSPILYVPPAMFAQGVTRGVIIGVQSSSFDGADIAGMTPIEDVFKIIEGHAPPGADLYRGDETKRKFPDAGGAKPQ